MTNELSVYEVNGIEDDCVGKRLVVCSHRNERSLIVITVPDGSAVTVKAADLIAAIANSTRVPI